jgi:photosystem II stability/assembly factor-like uncharacterized protein
MKRSLARLFGGLALLVGQTCAPAQDASLHDVVFLDSANGWAVGDHGTVLQTTDGGTNWHKQNTPVETALRGVSFVDAEHGWVVGGTTHPFLWNNEAVVLRTDDGGETWQQTLALMPALEQVQFFDTRHGLAWGRGSGGEPFGVFASDDDGRNWRRWAVGPPSAWVAGAFADPQHGVVVGSTGSVARLESGDRMPCDFKDKLGRQPRSVQLSPSGEGWLVGDGGLIQLTTDYGATWKPVEVLPENLACQLDWHTVAVCNDHIWIAGAPGSVVLHSPDGGQTWQGHATGCTTPLNKLFFVDATHGWAVGNLGGILHTGDGGETWQSQRQAGPQTAVLVLVADPQQLPAATLAKLATHQGYCTVVHLFTDPSADDLTLPARFAEAVTALGAASADCSAKLAAVPTADQREQLRAEIVRLLRQWRPAVVIVPASDLDTQPLTGLLAEVTQQVVPLAADEKQLPHLAEQLALPAWQVSRVFAILPPGERGTHRVDTQQLPPLGEMSLADLSCRAQGLLHYRFALPPVTEEYQLLAAFAGDLSGPADDLAAGLGIAPASRGVPVADPPWRAPGNVPLTHRRALERQRNLRSILRASGDRPALLAEVGQSLEGLDSSAGAWLLTELAAHFQQHGQTDLRAAALELLARRYPGDPLADPALVWLVQYYASGETAHVCRQVTPEVSQAVATEASQKPASNADGVQPAAAVGDSLATRRYTRAVQVVDEIARTRPLLYQEPQVRVPWAMAERKRGGPDSADRYLESLLLRYPGEAWQQCGEVECWLADPQRRSPKKPQAACGLASQRPTLDGILNEPLWSEISVPASHNSAIRIPNSAFAHDSNYLYLALRCEKSPTATYSRDDRPRTYDADLTGFDRVRILLDVDRDYTTWFDLSLDCRGWTNDACWQDRAWNPRWYVAAGGDDTHWTIEAAIPWSELSEKPPAAGDVWAVAIEQLAPGSTPDPAPGPERFVLLLFK